jgi:hypothetical protein
MTVIFNNVTVTVVGIEARAGGGWGGGGLCLQGRSPRSEAEGGAKWSGIKCPFRGAFNPPDRSEGSDKTARPVKNRASVARYRASVARYRASVARYRASVARYRASVARYSSSPLLGFPLPASRSATLMLGPRSGSTTVFARFCQSEWYLTVFPRSVSPRGL